MKNSEYLKSKGIEALWHFTHADNIPQIEGSGALCSKKALDELGILEEIAFVSDRQSRHADRQAGNWDMISLSLTRITPMFGKKFNKEVPMRMYKVCVTVADFPGVVFTDTNATYQGHCRHSTPEHIQFDLLREGGRGWDRFYARQAEVLVPYRIPTKYITKHWDLFPTSLEYRKAGNTNPYFRGGQPPIRSALATEGWLGGDANPF